MELVVAVVLILAATLTGICLTVWVIGRVVVSSVQSVGSAMEKVGSSMMYPPIPPEPEPKNLLPVEVFGPEEVPPDLTEDAMPLWAADPEQEEGWLVDPGTGRLLG